MEFDFWKTLIFKSSETPSLPLCLLRSGEEDTEDTVIFFFFLFFLAILGESFRVGYGKLKIGGFAINFFVCK